MPHTDADHALKVQLAAALRETEELRDAANTWLAERDALRADVKRLRDDIAAWLLDRADQYETDDPIWVGIADLAKGVARGDAQAAAKHGELDADLYVRLGIARAALATGGDDAGA